MKDTKKENGGVGSKILTVVGIVICVILVPILVVNCTLLVKSMINEDEVPSFGSYMPFIILTDSMKDEFPSGSIIVCKEIAPEDVKQWDIISYKDPESKTGAVTTHQVIDFEYDEDGNVIGFITKGSANNTQDKLPVPLENVIAKYTGFTVPFIGNVAMFMQTIPGLIVCVIVPIILLVGFDIVRRKINDKKHDTDKEDLLRELEELRRLKNETSAQSEECKVESSNEQDGEGDA